MKIIIFTLTIVVAIAQLSCKTINVDTNKRFNAIVDYIKQDSVIKKIVYRYYTEINCFEFPNTTRFIDYSIDNYIFINNIGELSTKEKWYLKKYVDSMNIVRKSEFVSHLTNFKKDTNCVSNYKFSISMDGTKWFIEVIPKETHAGLYRIVNYLFMFDSEDNITKVKTNFVME